MVKTNFQWEYVTSGPLAFNITDTPGEKPLTSFSNFPLVMLLQACNVANSDSIPHDVQLVFYNTVTIMPISTRVSVPAATGGVAGMVDLVTTIPAAFTDGFPFDSFDLQLGIRVYEALLIDGGITVVPFFAY